MSNDQFVLSPAFFPFFKEKPTAGHAGKVALDGLFTGLSPKNFCQLAYAHPVFLLNEGHYSVAAFACLRSAHIFFFKVLFCFFPDALCGRNSDLAFGGRRSSFILSVRMSDRIYTLGFYWRRKQIGFLAKHEFNQGLIFPLQNMKIGL